LPPPRVLPTIIVGRDLANELSLFVGDEVSLISPFGGIGPTGAMPKAKRFRVAGIFYSGLFEYDHNYAYIAIPAAQRLLASDDVVDGLQLKIKDPEHPEPVAAAVRALLPADMRVQDWKELNRGLFSALKLERMLMFVVLGFVILVAAFSIIANGMMLVLEKIHEIAILKAMGASDGAMLRVFLILGLTLGGLGAGGGIGLGTLACLGLRDIGFNLPQDVYYLPQLPVRIDPVEIAAVFGVSIFLVIAATLYPALLVARLRPVDGLRL
jgi:lipoprotein-releasing system permease protein